MSETKKIQILEIEFDVTTPYAEGQTINANEAKALNQTRAENIANNFRSKVKDAKESENPDEALTAVRAAFAEADAAYEFNVRTASNRSLMTPLEREATKVARAYLSRLLKENSMTLKAYTEENGKDYVEAKVGEIAATDAVQKLAKENLKRAEKANEEAVGIAL